MLVGVISDTHISGPHRTLPGKLVRQLRKVDHIIHAGDLGSTAALDMLAGLGDYSAVCGNVDPPEVARVVPARLLLELGGARIGVVHGNRIITPEPAGAPLRGDGPEHGITPRFAWQSFVADEVDCIVFGHSHHAYMERFGSVLLFNPGSAMVPRMARAPSYGLLRIGPAGHVDGEIIYLD